MSSFTLHLLQFLAVNQRILFLYNNELEPQLGSHARSTIAFVMEKSDER